MVDNVMRLCTNLVFLLTILTLPNASRPSDVRKAKIATRHFRGKVKPMPSFVSVATSAIHCVHLCLRNGDCNVAIFKPIHKDQHSKQSCQTFGLLTDEDITLNDADNAEKDKVAYMILLPRSCKEAYDRFEIRESGIVKLHGLGDHYCKMDMTYCSKGGWTLALKVNGWERTFDYLSYFWTNTSTYNVQRCLSNPNSDTEGKFQAFMDVSFEKICLDMTSGTRYRGIELPIAGKSLHKLFNVGEYIRTYVGRNVWKSLIYKSVLQPHCNSEGFNVKTRHVWTRLGIIANDEWHCIKADSVLGVGLAIPRPLCDRYTLPYVSGHIAYCTFTENTKIGTISRIFVHK